MSTDTPRIHVYTADITPLFGRELFSGAYCTVSAQRREKTDRLRFNKDKCLSLGAELLLLHACRMSGVEYGAERIVTDAYEKPRFESCPLEFNLSHSDGRVMCVISDLPVGCDVQKTGQTETAIARRFFHADEYAALLACKTDAERNDLFYRLWTLKESFLKCTGRGFDLPLNRFCLSMSPDGIRVEQSVDEAQYRFYENDLNDGCKYACCVRVPAEEAAGLAEEPVWEEIALEKVLLGR